MAIAIERGKRGLYETITLADDATGARVEIAPERGGMVTAWRARGRDCLFLDESTFLDPTKSVRGGIPVLFPIAGKLPGDRAVVDGRACALAQHGFARREAWRVVDAGTSVTLGLASTPATREAFPFEFDLRVSYALRGDSLIATATIANPGDVPLPLHLGFHPYLRCADASKRAARIEVNAEQALDNRTGTVAPLGAIDLTAAELDLHALDPRGGSARLRADGASVRLDYGLFRHVVIWTLGGRDFVCLEPWTAPPGALATGQGLMRVSRGETRRLTFSLTLEA